jgi:hypothetical protein
VARPTKYNWEDIKKHYEAGMSQAQIVLEFECPKSSLSEKINKEKWTQSEQVKTYIKGSIEVNEQKANLIEQDVRILEIADNIISEETRRRGLVFNLTEKILNNIDKTISEEIEIKDDKGKVIEKKEMSLDSKSAKEYIEAIDKASITLGVNQRHSNSQVQINNTNAQQNNTKTLNDFYEEVE